MKQFFRAAWVVACFAVTSVATGPGMIGHAQRSGTETPAVRPSPVVNPNTVTAPTPDNVTAPSLKPAASNKLNPSLANLKLPSNWPLISTASYVERMGKAFDQMDKNKDGYVLFTSNLSTLPNPDTAAKEPLLAVFDGCYLVSYDVQPAKKEKDPTKPGVWIDTPASKTVKAWDDIRTALKPTSIADISICVQEEATTKTMCTSPNGIDYPPNCPQGIGCFCQPGHVTKSVPTTKCVKNQSLGPGISRASFIEFAKKQVAAEDANKDSKIDQTEGHFLCMVG